MWRGQEKGAARIGEYGQVFRRTHDAKDPGPSGCVPAGPRGVAALDRISYTSFARLLADRLTATQRSWFKLVPNLLWERVKDFPTLRWPMPDFPHAP